MRCIFSLFFVISLSGHYAWCVVVCQMECVSNTKECPMDAAKMVGLKGLLAIKGCELQIHIYPSNRASKSGKMTFLASVDSRLVFNGTTVARIRGNQKLFASNGNQILDFTNSNDNQYPNSEWDFALKEIISTGSVQATLAKVGSAAVHRSLTVDPKTGKFVSAKLERHVTQEELGSMAKEFIDGVDEHADAPIAQPAAQPSEDRAAI